MKKTILITILLLGVGLASCNSYLDINESPNSPSTENIGSDVLMPAVEMTVATCYGNFLRITGGFYSMAYAHLNGTSNYVDFSQFQMSATRSSANYTQFTQKGLNNLKTIREKSAEEEEWGTYLAATTLRAFIYQALVDCYGEVPYAEALDPATTTKPQYDDGQVVYEGVLAELDEALALARNNNRVCTNFLYPSANATQWIQFANALKLKLLMRMAGVKDVSKEAGALVAENNFPTEDVTYTDCWENSANAMSPFYAEEFSTSFGSNQINICGNLAIIGTMHITGDNEYSDPRLPAYFETNSKGEYIGSVSGTQYPSSNSLTDWCRPVASYDMPVYLMSVAEVEFFIAEYYARYGSEAEAAKHYAAGVEASFASAGVEGADEYIARYPYDNGNYKQSLGNAKWVMLCGTNPFEGWCELRRLDYPAFSGMKGTDFYKPGNDDSFNTSSYVPYTLYTPIEVFGQVGENHLLERFPYPESSSSTNSNVPAFPGYTSPVFWAK
ncbi:MAG: SusD/RagB family nutrient-binding outer membrane lipoprotein [Prevotellaceae bacterium]|nr:SusD/RagB family nutrient-binding outer membrane lipoprotein [Prevotellaceae bacterium]